MLAHATLSVSRACQRHLADNLSWLRRFRSVC
jgi:hypothetical protein